MKKLLIAAAMTLSLGAAADEKADTCSDINALAESIMSSRQAGVDMAKMMTVAKNSGIEKLARILIIAAYEQPQFNGEDYRRKSVAEFKNKVYLQCVKEVG